jgi:hypothetical protein
MLTCPFGSYIFERRRSYKKQHDMTPDGKNRAGVLLHSIGIYFDIIRRKNFLISAVSKLTLRRTQLPTQCTSEAISTGVEREQRETEYSHSSSAKINKVGTIPPTVA